MSVLSLFVTQPGMIRSCRKATTFQVLGNVVAFTALGTGRCWCCKKEKEEEEESVIIIALILKVPVSNKGDSQYHKRRPNVMDVVKTSKQRCVRTGFDLLIVLLPPITKENKR